MKATMKKPPIKNNQQRSYKRSLNLHISLLIIALVAVLTRAFIPVPDAIHPVTVEFVQCDKNLQIDALYQPEDASLLLAPKQSYKNEFPNYQEFDFLNDGTYVSTRAFYDNWYYDGDFDCTYHIEIPDDVTSFYLVVFEPDTGDVVYKELHDTSELESTEAVVTYFTFDSDSNTVDYTTFDMDPDNPWVPDEMFKTLLMLVLAALVSIIIELLYSLSSGTSSEFGQYRRLVDPINSGLLIALLLPTTVPIYVLLLAVFIGVYVGKLIFGGYGYYIFNPALVGVLFAQIAFPEMYNVLSTPLMNLKAVFTEAATLNFNFVDMLIGNYEAVAIGSTSILVLFGLLLYLIITRVVDWRISGTFLLVMVVMSSIIGYINFGAAAFGYVAVNLMTGLTMFGAVFLIPESVSSPTSREAKLIYAAVIAIMTMLVRTVGGAFEGIVFAVLLGNMITPFLNRTVTRSNKTTLIKTSVTLGVIVLLLSVFLGFMVQGQLIEIFQAAVHMIGGGF